MLQINEFYKKAFILFLGVIIFRIGSHIPVPNVDPYALSILVKDYQGTVLELFNTFSGGSIKRFSILTIGIMPFISATIIVQMIGFFNARLKQLKEEGAKGQIKINKITRKLTFFIAFMQAISLSKMIASQTTNSGIPLVLSPDIGFFVIAISSLVTGSMFLIWLSDRMTEVGIGSGVSVIIFASIISAFPETISSIHELNSIGSISNIFLLIIIFTFFALLYLIVFFESSQRRVKLSSSNGYTENNYLPLKVNMGGIMPTIFASTVILIPISINKFFADLTKLDIIAELQMYTGDSTILYLFFFAILIMFFSFFYVGVTFSAKKVATNLQANASFIPSIRPGKSTEMFINKLVKRIVFIGSLYMIFVAIFPEILVNYFNIPFYLGGTSLLIMVTVTKEWIEQYNMSKHNNNYKNVNENLMANFK